MSTRKVIPENIEKELLFKNEACCCVCGGNNVHIHHIDGNNSNNKIRNLAVLCVGHHDQASTRSSMSKHLSPALVRKFKNDWELRTLRKRAIVRRKTISSREDKSFIKFEIKKLVYSLPAFPDKKSTKAIIEQLYTWNLLTGSTAEMISAFRNARWFLKGTQVSTVLDRIWEFFWQFVGPREVKMSSKDEREIIKAIELIGGLGEQSILLNENPRLFKNFFEAVNHFADIGHWYKNREIRAALKTALLNVRRELSEAEKYPNKKEINMKIKKCIDRC